MYNPMLLEDTGQPRASLEATHRVTLGMPHLASAGLSENWLQKELGHIHWLLLAKAAGRRDPDFRDEKGAPVYAAFCAVSIRDGDFGQVRENDRLRIRSTLARISRTQVASLHRLDIDGRDIGEVEMISTFVRREGGSNHTIARYTVAGLPMITPDGPGSELAATAAAFRADRLESHMGLRTGRAPLASVTFQPCPSTDFNGAGFLYFASFTAFVDRAEWAFDRKLGGSATTVRRDVFFRGNLDPGEDIRIDLLHLAFPEADTAIHEMAIFSAGSGSLLARAFTSRRWSGVDGPTRPA